MNTLSQQLTDQFYEWEKRGRGWLAFDTPVDLEPAFEPFWGHFIDGEIIDDGRRPSWLSSLFQFEPEPKATVRKIDAPLALPFTPDNDFTIYAVTLSKQASGTGAQVEQLLTMLSYRMSMMSFEIIGTGESISFQWVCRDRDAEFLYMQLRAFFPDVQVRETLDDKIFEILPVSTVLYTVDFGLQEEFMRPLATFSDNPEPYVSLFGILDHLEPWETVIVQVLFSGTANAWADSTMRAVTDDSHKQSFFVNDPDMPRLAKEKVSRPLFGATVRTVVTGDDNDEVQRLLVDVATALVHASKSSSNCLTPLSDDVYTVGKRLSDIVLRQSHRVGMLLNCRELAALVHYPGSAIKSKKLAGTARATKAAPDHLTDASYCLGENVHEGICRMVGISVEQRLRHIHLIGATGTGKSTLLHSLIVQDIHNGGGCMVLDPHGDLVESVLAHIPASRINDVVLIDPADSSFPVACNLLSTHTDIERDLLASDLSTLFKRFSTSWGDQMHSVLSNALLALLYNQNTYHIGDLRRFLIEPGYRTDVLKTVEDPDIAYYWQKEFPLLKGGSIASLLTRLDSFLRPKVIRAMVCQHKGLDVAQFMDGRKIVLVKLAQGLMGAENSYLLGALIVSKLQQVAMSRQAQAASERVPFFCYIDEFQHFVTPSMATILSGARKYGLGLVLAHQDMQQVAKTDPDIANSVLSNAATRISFRVGDQDAKRLQDGFLSFWSEDLQNLAIGEAIARVNAASADFNLSVIPTEPPAENYISHIIAHSRKRYAVQVELPARTMNSDSTHEKPVEPDVPERPPQKAIVESAQSSETVREHRYIQHYIKELAERHGYRASIEAPVQAGSGQVDVLAHKDDQTIAFEISVTTTAQWELHNVQKCIAAGYGQVVVCTNNSAKQRQIKELVSRAFSAEVQQHILVLGVVDIPSVFTQKPVVLPQPVTHKGYKVNTKYDGKGAQLNTVLKILRTPRKPSS